MILKTRLCIALLCALSLTLAVNAQSDLDAAVLATIERFNSRPGTLTEYREVGRISDETDAIIYLEVANLESGYVYPGVIDWMYAWLENGVWETSLPGDSDYREASRGLSDALDEQSQIADDLYRTQAQPGLVSPEALLKYELPFPNRAYGTITRSFDQHGKGKIDFDLQARDISAAKEGVIVFANDSNTIQTYRSGAWWYWNIVIIRHGEHEYSAYAHIAPDSIPAWIKDQCGVVTNEPNCEVYVSAGDVIAQEGNTGNSTNPHLHIEFGQGFDIVPYLDVRDQDQDGRTDEVIYAGYVYAEHNVGLNGFTPEEVAAWQYLTVLQSEIE